MTRALAPLLVVLLLAGCAHAPPPTPATAPPPAPSRPPPPQVEPQTAGPEEPPSPDDPFRVVREEVDAMLRAQALALWTAWTRGEEPDLARTYAGREKLLDAETVRAVDAAARRADGDERRALSLLHGFLAGEHLARQTAATAERLARARGAASVAWDGQTVAAARIPALLAAEPDAKRRAALHRAQLSAGAPWGPLADALAQDLDSVARRLGHPSLLALAADVRGESPEALAALAEETLDATGPAYEAALRALAQAELGANAEVRAADVARLLRASQDGRLFPPAKLLPAARALFDPLGLDLSRRPGATIDGDPRPRKDPRPLALPVEVPGDVRLSFAPGGGLPELRALLHEMGAAVYYAHVQSARLEYRRLGSVVPTTWSLLFEEVAGDPAWLVARTGDTEHHLAPLVRVAAARRLHAAREAALRVLLEVRRPRNAAQAAALLERAYARQATPEEGALALADRDPLLQSADTLRATLLAAQVEAFLAGRARGAWWSDPQSGAWLRRAFAEGARPTPAALARSVGATAVRAAPLADLARARLRWADER